MRFSIITPSYRQSDWLKLCVASVADQRVEVEHIVQDAGSDDGTADWLRRDPRVKAFVEKDAGMYDAINRGWRRAIGEVLAWLNCDEQYLPGALSLVERYFQDHPGVDMVFGNIVFVDTDGHYLCHRKVQTPLKYHTWTCHLSTLSCATFFRRKLIDSGKFFFNPDYRVGGDGEWMVRLLQEQVPMAALKQFTSVFTLTGANLGRHDARSYEEWLRLRNSAPRWARWSKPLIILHHRLRRLLGGVYAQGPFDFAIYTHASPRQRVVQHVTRPTYRCQP